MAAVQIFVIRCLATFDRTAIALLDFSFVFVDMDHGVQSNIKAAYAKQTPGT